MTFANMVQKPNEFGNKQEKAKDWFQIIAVISACISALTTGIFFAWSSPSIPRIIEDKINYDISLEEASYFTVIPPIGMILASFFWTKLSDVIGRKRTLLFLTVPYVGALILIAIGRSIWIFYVSRFLSGIGDACLFVCLPSYIGEITTPKVRGTWGNFLAVMIYAGQLVINVIGSYASVMMTAYIALVFPVSYFCTFVFMPESPYFYLMKNRIEDARASLQILRRKKDVEQELQDLKSDVDRQMSESGTWKDLFTISSNRKALYAAIFLRGSQQLGGIGSFVVYTQYIFEKSGGNMSASTSSIIFNGLCTALCVCAGYTLDKIGRQRSYFFSLLLCGIVLSCETVYFIIEQFFPKIDITPFNWIPLTGMLLYIVFYSFGLGIVPTLMMGELFSTSIKAKGLFATTIVFGAFISSFTKLFHFLNTTFGLYASFLFFAVGCLIASFFSFYFVPETKGKTLEEIQQDFKGSKNNKRHQKRALSTISF